MKNYIKITNGNSLILMLDGAKDWLDTIIEDIGESYIIEMSEDDFHKLPEFDGF